MNMERQFELSFASMKSYKKSHETNIALEVHLTIL